MLIIEYIVLFVLISILINLFVYRKFLYCELLFFQDLLLLIPTTILAIIITIVTTITIFFGMLVIPYVAWFKMSNLLAFIEPEEETTTTKELNEKYEVFIGTSFIFREIVSDSGIFVKNKYDFLMKNFPFLDPMNFVFVGNKNILKCDIFIDDKIENLTGGDIKILYTAYHNKSINNNEVLQMKKIIKCYSN